MKKMTTILSLVTILSTSFAFAGTGGEVSGTACGEVVSQKQGASLALFPVGSKEENILFDLSESKADLNQLKSNGCYCITGSYLVSKMGGFSYSFTRVDSVSTDIVDCHLQ